MFSARKRGAQILLQRRVLAADGLELAPDVEQTPDAPVGRRTVEHGYKVSSSQTQN